jgi:hypothetical protein
MLANIAERYCNGKGGVGGKGIYIVQFLPFYIVFDVLLPLATSEEQPYVNLPGDYDFEVVRIKTSVAKSFKMNIIDSSSQRSYGQTPALGELICANSNSVMPDLCASLIYDLNTTITLTVTNNQAAANPGQILFEGMKLVPLRQVG